MSVFGQVGRSLSNVFSSNTSSINKPFKPIVQYARDPRGNPIGAFYAIERNGTVFIGWSLCHKNDQPNKRVAVNIAAGRAELASSTGKLDPVPVGKVGLYTVYDTEGNEYLVKKTFYDLYLEFKGRCKNYYKNSQFFSEASFH
jgi:hypothetical protein